MNTKFDLEDQGGMSHKLSHGQAKGWRMEGLMDTQKDAVQGQNWPFLYINTNVTENCSYGYN